MWGLLFWLFLLSLGHIITDLSFYGVHRWILHGWIGNLPGFKALRMQHAHHHAYPNRLGGLLFTPLVNVGLLLLGCIFLYAALPFGLGYATYITLYAWRHARAHRGGPDAVSDHHLFHHLISPKWNFDIVYPITDVLLGTEAHEMRRKDKWDIT